MYLDRTKLTATQVCYLLGISTKTLQNWYKYINQTPKKDIPKDCPGLPPYMQASPKSVRYWYGRDVHRLYAFQQWIPRGRGGKMGHISQKYWSKKWHKTRQERRDNGQYIKEYK